MEENQGLPEPTSGLQPDQTVDQPIIPVNEPVMQPESGGSDQSPRGNWWYKHFTKLAIAGAAVSAITLGGIWYWSSRKPAVSQMLPETPVASATATPTPEEKSPEEENISPTVASSRPSPTKRPPSPTVTLTPIPLPTPTLTPTPTPIPPDITPPWIVSMTGPENNSTVTFNNFCFPMQVSDNRSQWPNILTNIRFDQAEWAGWSTEVSPCYQNVSNGSHTFSVILKDEAGNISTITSRTFTVQAN